MWPRVSGHVSGVCLRDAFTLAKGRFPPFAGSRLREGLGERPAERIALAGERRGAVRGPGIGGGKILLREKPGILQ